MGNEVIVSDGGFEFPVRKDEGKSEIVKPGNGKLSILVVCTQGKILVTYSEGKEVIVTTERPIVVPSDNLSVYVEWLEGGLNKDGRREEYTARFTFQMVRGESPTAPNEAPPLI